MESEIQRAAIQNPYAGIRNLESGIRNPGPSWILLHGATRVYNPELHRKGIKSVCNVQNIKFAGYPVRSLQMQMKVRKQREAERLKQTRQLVSSN